MTTNKASEQVGGLKLDDGSYGSPRWTYEILDCAMPMTFDTYSNCAHQCLYCFSFFQRAIGDGAEDYLHHKVRSVNVEQIKRMFIDPDKYAGQFKNYIKRRMTLQWGGLSDGFDWYEKKFLKSLDLLKFFCEIDYPISISTKGVWFVDDERYRSVLKGAKNVHFKYSIITDNEDHVKKIEPGVPSAAKRFEAMRKLNELGIGATTLRFRPYILGVSDLCIDSMFEKAAEVGCYSVTTEFLGWESRSSNTSAERLAAISKVVGYDVMKFYRENSSSGAGLLRLNYELKRPHMKRMKEKAAEVGLKFFVSDAHHKEDSYHAGCCGLPEDGPLSNVNHGQYAHAILIAKEKGIVRWSDISEEAQAVLGDIPYRGAAYFPTDTDADSKRFYQTMYDYMRDVWNNPKSMQSPARYFGGALVPAHTDDHGDIVYVYNQSYVELGLQLNSVNAIAKELRMVGKENADRYDEATKDGTDFGHVAYPIFVFSRKRAGRATTMRLLDQSRINHTIVVPQADYEDYAREYPNADIVVVPSNGEYDSIYEARQMIYERSKEEGYPYIWMLDDDIAEINAKGEHKSIRAMFSYLEKFVEDYSNVAMLGPSSFIQQSKEFDVNEIPRGLFLLNLQTGMDFNSHGRDGIEIYEDVAFALDHISRGYVTVTHNAFTINFHGAIGGGAEHLHLQFQIKNETIKLLSNMYPDVISVQKIDSFRNEAVINRKALTSTIRSRHVEKLMEENE